ncbi:hypothetical protein J4437_04015 [Candidatus Woesearchaeota archaeon]|nr:hypothetical protein [uncultured archaeon]MBS3123776.1 hypothetical protein [Candidatus Woesearchaeota archaeon]
MDVDQIQKINTLALQLLNQGLAKDRADAVIQAEKIYKGQGGEDYAEIRGRLEPSQPAVTNLRKEDKVSLGLSEDKIKEILEKNTNFLVKTIKEFHEKVSSMEKEMVELKQKLRNVHSSVSTSSQESSQQAPQPAQQVAQQTYGLGEIPANNPYPRGDTVKSNQSSASHPRVGNFSGADVSIEKFFYMGHK